MKKAHKNKSKKHKKPRRYSTSSSSSGSDQFEWVEKKTEDHASSHTFPTKISNNEEQKKQLERDEWMNIESFLPCISRSDLKNQKRDTQEEDKSKVFLDKPGQYERELNPYWRNGGNGLPQSDSKGFNYQSTIDVNWLKKSLRRAEEQAIRDGRSLEEVAAERWGSLENIKAMILQAERISNSERSKGYHRQYYDKNHRDLSKSFVSRRRNRSRSRSKSRSRSNERSRKYSSHYSSHNSGRKKIYQKPSDNEDYHEQTTYKSSNSHVKNWKKDKNDDRKYESESSTSGLKEIYVEETNKTNETNKYESINVLTEAEMNKLGARIVKAEIMGDEELAAQLKAQLEEARKLIATNNANNAQNETVILTRTDDKGVARPLQPRNQSKGLTESHNKKKKTVETHISGERIRHFADDDKYSLQQMFEREKGRSANEDEAMFAKFASKNTDNMDEMFEQQIARTDLDAKHDKRDRMHAIKEHQNISKSLDNCYWCPDSKNMIKHMIVTMDSAICLSLPSSASLTTGHCILTPTQHTSCQLQLDEDVWERLKEVKRNLTKMFMDENSYPIFFEIYKKRYRFSHMQLICVPLPKEIGETAPMYFKKALLECETEWSMNKKIVELKDKGIRHAVPNGMSYFMVEFASHPGYAHVIENEEMFPKNFAEEVIGGMLDLDCNLWRKPKRQNFEEQREKVLEFTTTWERYNSS